MVETRSKRRSDGRAKHGLLAAGAWLSLAACAIDFDRHFMGDEEACGESSEDCVPAAPAGWQGPFLIAGAEGPGCSAPLTARSEGTLCGACACAGEVACSAPEVLLHAGDCAQPLEATLPVAAQTCAVTNASGGLNAALGAAPTASADCTPSGGGASQVALCAPEDAGSCAGGGTCLPGSGGAACVLRDGAWPCPTEFPAPAGTFGGAGAACGACGCLAPEGSCEGSSELHFSRDCSDAAITLPHDGETCVLLDEAPRAIRYLPPATAACQPTGGEPEGSTLATLCCRS